jgi:uncharacterized phage protein (TIGR02218 family)
MPSAALIDHLGSNVTFMVPIWKMTSTVGATVAAYAAHTRDILFDSVTYLAAQVEPTRFSQTLGVQQANHVELFGIFDSIVTEENLQGGKWKNAKIVFEYVNYLDLTMGSVGRMKGQAGKVSINNGTFTVELRSLSDLLHQEIGSLTSPLDRNRTPEDLGVSMAPFTHARAVTASPDRRNFTVDGAAQANDYFKYGRATFTSGANNGQAMEIKSNTGNVIELQLPVRSTIAIADTVTLIAGYDSTREQARDKFAAVQAFDGEPDLPGIKAIIQYPE